MTTRRVRRLGRTRGRPAVVAVVVALAAAVSGSCTSAASRSLPPRPAVVTVGIEDFHFGYNSHVPAGQVVFRFVNRGRVVHQPDLVELPDDLPPIDQQLHGEKRAFLKTFARILPRSPGQSGTFATRLAPGVRYAIVCFSEGPDHEPYALKGMNSEFRAGATAAPAPTDPQQQQTEVTQ